MVGVCVQRARQCRHMGRPGVPRKELDKHMATGIKPKLTHVYKNTGALGENSLRGGPAGVKTVVDR